VSVEVKGEQLNCFTRKKGLLLSFHYHYWEITTWSCGWFRNPIELYLNTV